MKIGIYGGTFDPPHNGHVHACKCFYGSFNLDKLFIIPTAIPPHKTRESSVSGEDRLEMARLAFASVGERIEISDLELRREGKSYTKLTIQHFVNSGIDEIYLLCGTDMFVTFDTWYDFTYIFEHATIVCMRRESNMELDDLINQKAAEYKKKYNARIEFINEKPIEISSSELRKGILSGESAKYLSKDVYEFIIKRGLYQ